MNISQFWRRITSSRYAIALEAAAHMERALKEEIARLRAENRALLNSILGIAGVPPITVIAEPAAVAPRLGAAPTAATSEARVKKDAPEPANAEVAAGRAKNGVQIAVPTRRRSWHQINRMLEFEAAKKKEQVVGKNGE